MKDSVNISGIDAKAKAYLIRLLKASVARHLWHNEGYYESSNKEDEVMQKALDILKK